MLNIILSNSTIEVKDGSTLFDIMVEHSQIASVWDNLTENNLKLVKLVSEDGGLLDQRSDLAVDHELSVREKGEVVSHFYLREKNEVEVLREKVTLLESKLKSCFDGEVALK